MTKHSEHIKPLPEKILKKIYTSMWTVGSIQTVSDVSYRQIKYWEKQGYIKPARKNEKGWRRINSMTIWAIIIIEQYSKLSLPPSKLDFFLKSDKLQNWFRESINALSKKTPHFLITNFTDTLVTTRSEQTLLKTLKEANTPLTVLNLNKATESLIDLLLDKKNKARNAQTWKFTTFDPDEIKLIKAFRGDEYDSIQITKLINQVKMSGIKYYDNGDNKNLNEILKEINKSPSAKKVTTNRNDNGKLTRIKVEKKIS